MFRSLILPAVFMLAACSASQAQTGSCDMFMNFETSSDWGCHQHEWRRIFLSEKPRDRRVFCGCIRREVAG